MPRVSPPAAWPASSAAVSRCARWPLVDSKAATMPVTTASPRMLPCAVQNLPCLAAGPHVAFGPVNVAVLPLLRSMTANWRPCFVQRSGCGSLIAIPDRLDDRRRAASRLEQRDPFRTVADVDDRLRGDDADASASAVSTPLSVNTRDWTAPPTSPVCGVVAEDRERRHWWWFGRQLILLASTVRLKPDATARAAPSALPVTPSPLFSSSVHSKLPAESVKATRRRRHRRAMMRPPSDIDRADGKGRTRLPSRHQASSPLSHGQHRDFVGIRPGRTRPPGVPYDPEERQHQRAAEFSRQR